ncbi:GSCOCT00013814001.3-RA-CDS, partial [Cotesia congregata]
DQKSLKKGSEIFKWPKKISKVIGLWPLSLNPYLFCIFTCYFTSYMVLAMIDMYKSATTTEMFIDNVTETLGVVLVYVRILLLRFNISSLGGIYSQVFKNYNVSDFENSQEIEVFMQFINKGISLLKGFASFIIGTEVIWYFSSLAATPEFFIDDNNQTIFIIPYKLYFFHEINSLTRYYLTFLCIMPSIWIFGFGNVSVDCILISLLFYISGKMAVLTMRIEALENCLNPRKKLNGIIAEHSKLLKMGDGVKDAYSAGLLVYLVIINSIICILGYQILISFMAGGQEADIILFSLFLMEMYAMLSIYCMISEHMTAESLKCCEGFYNIRWYNLPIDCSKDIVFCIERSQQPLALWAGQFTTFSSVTLTDVTKTALSYLSVLRSFKIAE